MPPHASAYSRTYQAHSLTYILVKRQQSGDLWSARNSGFLEYLLVRFVDYNENDRRGMDSKVLLTPRFSHFSICFRVCH